MKGPPMSTCASLWLAGGLLGRLLGFFFKRVGWLQGLECWGGSRVCSGWTRIWADVCCAITLKPQTCVETCCIILRFQCMCFMLRCPKNDAQLHPEGIKGIATTAFIMHYIQKMLLT